MIEKLTDEERKRHLKPLIADDWVELKDRDAIEKKFVFKNFNQVRDFKHFNRRRTYKA